MQTPSEAVAQFWADYVAASGATGPYTAWGFGDDGKPDLMTELGLLVRDGPKRATTSRKDDYEKDGEPIPSPGDHSVILDGEGRPLCIIRTTSVEIRPARSMTRSRGTRAKAIARSTSGGERTSGTSTPSGPRSMTKSTSCWSASPRSGHRPPIEPAGHRQGGGLRFLRQRDPEIDRPPALDDDSSVAHEVLDAAVEDLDAPDALLTWKLGGVTVRGDAKANVAVAAVEIVEVQGLPIQRQVVRPNRLTVRP
jgi:uncharacterized protein YhfF